MKTPSRWKPAFLTALLTLLSAGATLAQSQMNYQGRLTDSAGNAVPDAQYSITFDIFDSAVGGTKKWGPQTIPADVVQGRFNVILGPTDTASRNIVSAFDGGTRYLQITYQGNPILPRQQILSAPTAFYSQNAGQLANVFVNNGNVGINTTNPISSLHVNGYSPGAPAIFLTADNRTVGSLGLGLATQPGQYGAFTLAGDATVFCDTGKLHLKSSGSSAAMTIVPNGNVGIGTTIPGEKLTVVGTGTASTSSALSVFNSGFASLLRVRDDGNVGISTTNPQTKLDVAGDITCVAINLTSDRNAKEKFKPVNARAVLDKVARLPISEWQYKGRDKEPSDGSRHIGPMAQDFREAFALGRDDKHITSVDADGVALAAIQGLNEKLESTVQIQSAELSELRRTVNELKGALERLQRDLPTQKRE